LAGPSGLENAAAAWTELIDLNPETGRLKLAFSATLSWLGEERNCTKASKLSDAQKVFILKQGEEGTPVAEVCHKAGISKATYFSWT
jgi:hypothetical protein